MNTKQECRRPVIVNWWCPISCFLQHRRLKRYSLTH